MDKKLLTQRIDKVIGELVSIKLEFQETEQLEIECAPKKDPMTERIKEVIDYFSKKRIDCGISKLELKKTYQRIRQVKDRLKDSSVQDAKDVIDSRFIAWLFDEQYKQYLTIETIFQPSKYYKYLDASGLILKNNRSSWDEGKKATKVSTDDFSF